MFVACFWPLLASLRDLQQVGVDPQGGGGVILSVRWGHRRLISAEEHNWSCSSRLYFSACHCGTEHIGTENCAPDFDHWHKWKLSELLFKTALISFNKTLLLYWRGCSMPWSRALPWLQSLGSGVSRAKPPLNNICLQIQANTYWNERPCA